MTVIRDCHVPHHGECGAVLSAATVVATVQGHGFTTRVTGQVVEAWEPAFIFPLDGSPARDASGWVIVPREVHALAAWLGY